MLKLISSSDGEPDADVTQAFDPEIDRRSAEVELGDANAMTLNEYRAQVRQRVVAHANP
ncbi:MAG TPA: hypothetical protein VJ891_07950 [Casimicrobiaceae bacterium]|nr:hypothetical protein [Casimicrobiaceae bacterium]